MHRLHVTLMFAHLTAYAVGTGAIGNKALELWAVPNWQLLVCAIAGVLFSALIVVHHERIFEYSIAARRCARQIEQGLGLSLYAEDIEAKHWWGDLSAYRASQFIYVFTLVAWLVLLGFAACRVAS